MPKTVGRPVTKNNSKTLQPSDISNRTQRRNGKERSSETVVSKSRKTRNSSCKDKNEKQKVPKTHKKKESSETQSLHNYFSNCENNETCESQVKKRTYKNKKTRDCSSAPTALDEIILELNNDAKNRDDINFYEQQIASLATPQKSCSNSPVKMCTVTMDDEEGNTSTGIQIFDPSAHQCLYSLRDLEKMTDFLPVENVCKIPLSNAVYRLMLSSRTNNKTIPKEKFILFVFRLLSVHNENEIVNRCMMFLLDSVERGLVWTPSIHDIVEVLVNFGCTSEENCPLLKLFRTAQNPIPGLSPRKRKKPDEDAKQFELCKRLDFYNLAVVFKLLTKLIEKGLYEDDVLVQVVLLLCWLLLDAQFESIQEEMQKCVASCLYAISDLGWNSKWARHLSISLSEMTEKPQDAMRICNFLLPAGRIQDLRKTVSLRVAHSCLGTPYSCKRIPTPADVVSILKSHPLTSMLKDLDLLEVTLDHIECAVGEDVQKSDVVALKELSHMFRSTAGRIVDSIKTPKATHVKSMLFSLVCKWTFLHQQFLLNSGSSWKRSKLSDADRDSNLENSQSADDSLPSPAKYFRTFSPRTCVQAIPSYKTRSTESPDSSKTKGNSGSPMREMNQKGVARSQKGHSFSSFQQENIISPLKKTTIPSYNTKVPKQYSNVEEGPSTNGVSNGDNHSLILRSNRGSSQKSHKRCTPLSSPEKKVLPHGRRKLNFNTYEDMT